MPARHAGEASTWPQVAAQRLAEIQAHFDQARYELAMPLALALHAAASEQADHGTAARSAVAVAKMHANQDKPDSALRWAAIAREGAAVAGDLDLQAAAGVLLASEHARCDAAASAMQAMAEVLRLVEGVQNPQTLSTAFTGLAFAYRALGMPVHGLQAARQALAAAGAAQGDSRLRPLLNLVAAGLEALELLEPDDATALEDELAAHLQWIEVQTADYDQQGRRGRASYRHLAAAFAARRGDWRAVRELLLSLAGRPFSGPHDMKRDIWLDLARAHRALGDPVLAQAAAAEAAAEQARTGRLPRAVELQRLALLAELQGRADEALALAREHHRRVLANVLRAQEARIDALNDRLLAQALSSENQALRRRNEDLAADVRQASRLATTDALTGLANRRALLAQWPRLQALGVPLTLALLDVDHFKQINDRHSHAAGDAVLCALAQVMATTLREHDLLARWGGEEFALVLVGADAGEAAQALQRVCDRVRAHDWAGLVPGLRVTVSVGHVGAQPDQTLDAACARADVMLYRAKHQGRDRVVGAEPPAPEAAAASAEHAPSAQISPEPRPASAPPPACPP